MPKETLFATLPDGSVVTRTTDRDYQHLVAVLWANANGVWGAWRWSTRQDLAGAALREARGNKNALDAQIVAVAVASPAYASELRSAKRRRSKKSEWAKQADKIKARRP